MDNNLMSRFQSLLQGSSTFRDNLSEFLLNRKLNELNYANPVLFTSIKDELSRNLQGTPPSTDDVMSMFNRPDWSTLTRTLQTMKELPVPYPIDQRRVSEYLEELKFKTNWSIDLEEFSKVICDRYDPKRIRVFHEMHEEQKHIIELLNQDQMEALANFRSKSIKFLTGIMRIASDQRDIIMSLTEAEIQLYKTEGSANIQDLLSLDAHELTAVLGANGQTNAEPRSLYTLSPRAKFHIDRVRYYNPEGMETLKNLLAKSRNLNDVGFEFLASNECLTDAEIQEFNLRTDEQKEIITNLSGEMRDALVGFDEYDPSITLRDVLKLAIAIGPEMKDMIVLLTSDQLESMLDGSGAEDLSDIAHLSLDGQANKLKLGMFVQREKEELFDTINHDTRRILSKLYVLLPDGLDIIKELGPEKTYETFTIVRGNQQEMRNFNMKQQILSRRIQRLSEEEKQQIFELTEEQLRTFNGIFQLGSDSIDSLTHLSRDGIIVLNSVKDLNPDQIRFVLEQSSQGISVLANNGQLNPRMIESLRQLHRNKSKFMINLNLDQRIDLSVLGIEDRQAGYLFTQEDINTLQTLNRQEKELLSTIITLTEQEAAQRRGITDTNFIESLDPDIGRMWLTLRNHQIDLMSKTFEWRTEENLVFGLWKSLLDPNPEEPTIDEILRTMVNPMLVPQYQEKYLKLIAGVVMAYRSANPQGPIIVENMATAIETMYGPVSKLEFYLHLLNYSIEDNVALPGVEDLFSRIPDTEFSRAKLREFCDISRGDIPFIFRWMLANPIERYREISNSVTRDILVFYANDPNPETLNAILEDYRGIRGSDVIQSLRTQLRDNDYLLAHNFFFNPQRDHEKWKLISEWLMQTLTPDQQYEFLNAPADHLVADGFNVLEYSMYQDEGCPYPFFRNLNSNQLEQLFDRNPVLILRAIVWNGHFQTLQKFAEGVGTDRLMRVIENNRGQIFVCEDDEFIFGNHRLEDLAQTIRWIATRDTSTLLYLLIQTQLAIEAKERGVDQYNHIMDILATDGMNRDEIEEQVRRGQPLLYGPSCARRRRLERSLAPVCIDSTKEEEISMEEKEHLIRSVFGDMQPEHNDLYQLMMSDPNEANLKELSEKVANLHLDSVDSDIRDILQDIKNVAHDRGKMAEILGRSNVAMRIQKFAERTGLGLTSFMVLSHLAQGDLKSLGWDSLNLSVFPKLGSKITEKLLAKGQRVTGPLLGRAIGNFGAFLGLAESIKARKDAQDPLDIEIANINIISNSVFILADIPALVTDVLGSFEVATGVIGEFTGPFGTAVSVGVIVLSQSISAALQLENISKQIKLTAWQEVQIFVETWLKGRLPDDIMRDATVKNIYNHYLTEIIQEYQNDYGMMAISLPSILKTEERYCEATNIIKKDIFREPCNINTNTSDIQFDFSPNSSTTDPFTKLHGSSFSMSVPSNIQGYDLVCGPRENNALSNQVHFESILSATAASDQSSETGQDVLMDRKTDNLYIPQQNNKDCDNMLLYKNQTSKATERILFYLKQNARIKIPKGQPVDMFSWGTNLTLFDHGLDDPSLPRSKFVFLRKLNHCTLRKEGLNLLVIKYNGTFACHLGGESRRQVNVAMVQGNFTDIKNIHGIIGSEGSDRINVSHSAHVDGNGGNDTIHAQNSTVVKSYYGDVIHGNTKIQLPMNVSDIYKIVVNEFITVYNRNNQSVQVDAGSSLQTSDKFLIHPMKTNNETHVMTHLYVHKHIDGDVILEDELAILGQMETSRFNCSKQITSRNYDIALSDNTHSIFQADVNNHNFYWEAADGKMHLYMFEFIVANVTISKARGILDFSKFHHVVGGTKEKVRIVEPVPDEGPLTIDIKGLHVNLLANRQLIKVTFDGENYYDIKNGRLERDYCPYSSKVVGRLIVNGRELFGHHNCFEFHSDKIVFYKQNRHLLLSSGRYVLTITNFYPLVHENLEVSLKLNSRVMGPKEFRKKASNPDPLRFYEIIEPGLTIYHNLPIDKDQIGVIYTNQSSILDHDIEFQGDNLLLTNRNGISVTVVDWKNYQEAREVMFAFNDTLIFNTQCISSTCTPEFILEEFHRQKQLIKPFPIRRKRNAHPDPLEITGNSTHPLSNTFSAFKDNVNLLLLFVQNFLDNKYPLPQFPSINPEEVCAYATNITQSFKKKLTETGQNYGITLKDFDCFELYSNITEHLRNEEYSKATMILNSFAEEMLQLPAL